jgi:hypothetical protein
MYIGKEGQETAVPLYNISFIRLSPRGFHYTTRGIAANYVIEYASEGSRRAVVVTIVKKTSSLLTLFKEAVLKENPGVKIKDKSSILDLVIGCSGARGPANKNPGIGRL